MPQRFPPILIQSFIQLIRGHKVILDHDLARLYGVTTFNLNKAVKRNLNRFPADFMFRLTRSEYHSLRFQSGILKRGKHSKYLPSVFTQEGVAMLSSVLRSDRAIKVNIEIMRAFVRFRNANLLRKHLAQRLDSLEHHLATHDSQIDAIFNAIRNLMELPKKRKTQIGFRA